MYLLIFIGIIILIGVFTSDTKSSSNNTEYDEEYINLENDLIRRHR